MAARPAEVALREKSGIFYSRFIYSQDSNAGCDHITTLLFSEVVNDHPTCPVHVFSNCLEYFEFGTMYTKGSI